MQPKSAPSEVESQPILESQSFKPLKICLLGYRSKPHCGGQGVYIRYLSAALQKLGHSVDVISGEPYPELVEGVRLIKLPGLNLFEKENRLTALRWKDFQSATSLFEWFSVLTGGFPEPYTFGQRVLRYFNETKTDYDLIHDNQSLCYGLLGLQQKGYPVITTIHHPITKDRDIALNSARNRRHRILIRRWHYFLHMQGHVVRNLKHLLTVSNQSRHDISKAFKISETKVNVVHNGIDTVDFSPLPEIQRRPFRIMATASADIPLKGLDYLLKAIAELIPRFPDLNLVVLGSPKPGGHTESLINRLNLGNVITFVNGLSTEEINRYYAEASIAVIPSLYEGFGLPAGEAMSSGVPVISTTGGALPEVVGEAGLLVPPGNAGALANAMTDLLENAEKRDRLGAAGRKRILEKFSWDVAARQMTRYYYKVLQDVNHQF
ncbi:glycosyltransferase family 4 protein [bacterium]|nr:glycosyltransferase family 4 protein [bacterium]